MLDSFGKRLKYCRTLIGLHSKEFVQELNKLNVNIAYEAFTRWETDLVKFPTIEIVDKMVNIFRQLGLKNINTDWLLYGDGYPPLPIYLDNFNEDEQAYLLPSILSEQDNYITKTVIGNWAKPIATQGSHLIVKKVSLDNIASELENKVFFCKNINQTFHIGILKKQDNQSLVYIKNDEVFFINIKDIDYIGRVVWIKFN